MSKFVKLFIGLGLIAILLNGFGSLTQPIQREDVRLARILSTGDVVGKYQYIGQFVKSLRDMTGRKYCSASEIEYKGRVYTVTNRHCCEPFEGSVPIDGFRYVGTSIQKIIHVSPKADVCILTSSSKRGLRVSDRSPSQFEEVFVMGHPRGEPLTVREGRYQYTDKVCIDYGGLFSPDIRCEVSYFTSVVIRPGNSGSALFNTYGEVVGIVYAGNDINGIAVPREDLLKQLEVARYAYGKNK